MPTWHSSMPPASRGSPFFTDRFEAADAPCVAALWQSPQTLLELRLFGPRQEFWAHRTALGRPFVWRVADEDTLAQNAASQASAFLRDPAHHELVRCQYLDIDTTDPLTRTPASNGCVQLRTTVGGRYRLPLQEGQTMAQTVVYLNYNDNGLAEAADWRLAGFTDKEAR